MHQTGTLAKYGADRKRVQDANGRLERFPKLSIVSSKFVKDPRLLLKNGGDGINRIACLKLLGEGMIDQSGPRLVFVLLESSVEEVPEGGG
jgi:hypothetical protein